MQHSLISETSIGNHYNSQQEEITTMCTSTYFYVNGCMFYISFIAIRTHYLHFIFIVSVLMIELSTAHPHTQ